MSTFKQNGFTIVFVPSFWWFARNAMLALIERAEFEVTVYADTWTAKGLHDVEYLAFPIPDPEQPNY